MAGDAPIVIGSIANRLTPAPGAVLDVVPWGLDIIRRPFTCLTADFARLVPKKGSPDRQYPKMFLQSYSEARVEGLLSESELTYVGLQNGGFPKPLVTRSVEDRTASVERNFTIITPGFPGFYTRQYNVLFQTPTVTVQHIIDANETTDRISIPSPIILQSEWRMVSVEGETGKRNLPTSGSGFPPSVNWRIQSNGGIKTPIPGTPFFDFNITYYWVLT